VLLPASEAPESVAPRRAAAPKPQVAASKGTVLVVDDEEVVRTAARSMLAHRGYRVMLASNGVEALDCVRRHPDVAAVLLDWTMPLMGGEEAAREIRSLRPDLPIVVATGFSYAEAAARFDGLGISGFVQKPFKTSVLVQEIESTLSPR
jgi:CheY-like chemotaxis protein